MTTNPLAGYYRSPGVYIKLPSDGKYWEPGSLDLPPNGEIPVLPMSGRDDIALKNADGLMNGSTTVSVIQSCIPSIKNAWAMPMIDIDAIMIAIRQTSYGQNMSFSTKCTKCGEFHDYEIDLSTIRDTIHLPDYTKPLIINDLMITFKPTTYLNNNSTNMEKFAQQQVIKSLQDSKQSEEEKIRLFKEALADMTALTVNNLASFIESIITPDGTKVTDKDFIREFIDNADQHTFNTLKDAITAKNSEYHIDPVKTVCTNCGHEDTRAFQFDPSNFFG